MRELSCDLLVVGGGTGGFAAAMAAAENGLDVVITEETDWLGGQLTSQAVPPDEHPWIETLGCTRRYRRYRDGVRKTYRRERPLSAEMRADPWFNPGGGWVSNLCHEPAVGVRVLSEMLPARVRVLYRTILGGGLCLAEPEMSSGEGMVHTVDDELRQVVLRDLDEERDFLVNARYFIDATELGDLVALSGTEHVVGAESQVATGEPSASDIDRPDSQQGFTWVFAMAYDEGSHRVIDRPSHYDFWREFQPPFWPGKWLGLADLNPQTLQPRHLPLFSNDWLCWFKYRQIVSQGHPATIVNWPQNDYICGPLVDVPRETSQKHLLASRELSLCLFYWLQTECPRPDGGTGYPGLYLCPELTGTSDGLAKMPYVRESRRIRARTTILEQHVAATCRPGERVAEKYPDSVGIGAYRIDLHPTTRGDNYLDTSTLPFQIPLGALIPVRTRNLLAGAKNIGTTHITNGCYRLHPVEWNIGEAAGLLVAFCLANEVEPWQVHVSPDITGKFQNMLRAQGIELAWPEMRAL